MSTRSNIGIINVDGSLEVIYCHFDGYLEGVGRVLLENYNTEEKVRELLSRGHVSSLETNLIDCKFYHESSDKYSSIEEYNPDTLHIEYQYLYNVSTKEWIYSQGAKIWRSLTIKDCIHDY